MQKVQLIQITPDQLCNHIQKGIEQTLKKLNLTQALPTKTQDAELLTIEETLAFLKCSKQALWNWRKNGILPSYRLGNRVYYKKSEILSKLQKQN